MCTGTSSWYHIPAGVCNQWKHLNRSQEPVREAHRLMQRSLIFHTLRAPPHCLITGASIQRVASRTAISAIWIAHQFTSARGKLKWGCELVNYPIYGRLGSQHMSLDSDAKPWDTCLEMLSPCTMSQGTWRSVFSQFLRIITAPPDWFHRTFALCSNKITDHIRSARTRPKLSKPITKVSGYNTFFDEPLLHGFSFLTY